MTLIDIGSQKQLFVDDYIIESVTDTMRVMNPAVKAENNPVLAPERPWEGEMLYMSNVIYDSDDRIFKMWYAVRTFEPGDGDNPIVEGVGHHCFAVSEDGVNWERPNLGLGEFDGSTRNNILPPTMGLGEGRDITPYFFRDPNESDPAKKYKGLVRTGSTTTPGMQIDLYFSPDTRAWTPYENNPVIDTSPKVGRWGPTHFMGWDPIREVYAVHMENSLHRRSPMGKRLIGRAESPDMVHWGEAETIVVTDELDPPDTEFYAMPVAAYEGIYVGILWIFRTTSTTHHPEIVFSRDGIRYDRPYREPFIPRGSGVEFDSVSIYSHEPIAQGDRIFTFYNAWNWRSPETWYALGDKSQGAIGLGISRLDGFVSLDGVKGTATMGYASRSKVAEYSEMVTRSFSFTGSELHLNMQPALQQWGAGPCELRVEVLEPNHDYIEGYEFDDSDPITTDSVDHVASWNGGSDLSRLEGKAIKLRFYFKNAKLYSFRFR